MIYKRRRKNKLIKDVIEEESGKRGDKLDQSQSADIVYRESSVIPFKTHTEFGTDEGAEEGANALPTSFPHTHTEFGADEGVGEGSNALPPRLSHTHTEFGADEGVGEGSNALPTGFPHTHTEFGTDEGVGEGSNALPTGFPHTHTEFGTDEGVTENAPYHNMSDYRMVAIDDDDNTVDTQSS